MLFMGRAVSRASGKMREGPGVPEGQRAGAGQGTAPGRGGPAALGRDDQEDKGSHGLGSTVVLA